MFLFFLGSCQAPELNVFSLNTYQDDAPLGIKTYRIMIVSEVERFDNLPHIEHRIPVSPEEALRKWAENRFYASQSDNIDEMRIVVEKAYLTEAEDKSDKWYTFDNVLYKLTYDLRIDFIKNGKNLYTQSVGGFESTSLPARSSLSDKEGAFEKMMNQMIKKVNNQILLQMPKEFIL